MKVVTMKLFIWASFLFPSQSVLLSVNEQTHLKIFIQHQFFGVGFKILRTLGVFNSSLSFNLEHPSKDFCERLSL